MRYIPFDKIQTSRTPSNVVKLCWLPSRRKILDLMSFDLQTKAHNVHIAVDNFE